MDPFPDVLADGSWRTRTSLRPEPAPPAAGAPEDGARDVFRRQQPADGGSGRPAAEVKPEPPFVPFRQSVLKHSTLTILAACCFTTSLSASELRTLHLSPTGDDRAAGAADAPLASLAGARDAIRRFRTEDNHAGPVRVIVADGRYPLREPVVFESRDGGGPDAAVTYAAAPGAMPVFDAGQPLSEWTVEDDGSWSCRLPAGAPETIEALWVNERRAVRARFPASGEAVLEGVTETILEEGGGRLPEKVRQELRLPPEAFEVLAPLDAAQLAAVDIIFYHKWDVTRRRPLALDAATRTAIVEGRGMKPWNRLDHGIPFILENLPGPPTTPGEWSFAKDGTIRYRPLPGESPDTSVAIIPTTDRFLELRGDAAAGEPVSHITFQDLTFAHAQGPLTTGEFEPAQSASGTAAVITVHGGNHVVFQNCTVRHTGTWGLWIKGGSRDCNVIGCRFDDLGAGAIRIGDTVAPLTTHITIHNNRLTRGGRVNASACGLLLTHAADCAITHNEIADFSYTGISLGWVWGYGDSPSKRNRVAHNHVHTIGQGVLSDMGGIYTLGKSEGTVISHNVFHDIVSRGYGGWGLYTDEGSSGIVMENNLVFNTKTGGFHQHYGRENIIRNNIFISGREHQLQATRVEDHLSFTLENNIFWWDSPGPVLAGPWERIQHVSRNNLFWNAGGHPVTFKGKALADWQAAGHESGSVIADPMFADPAAGDFSLRADSPALKAGFNPFDWKIAGPLPEM